MIAMAILVKKIFSFESSQQKTQFYKCPGSLCQKLKKKIRNISHLNQCLRNSKPSTGIIIIHHRCFIPEEGDVKIQSR